MHAEGTAKINEDFTMIIWLCWKVSTNAKFDGPSKVKPLLVPVSCSAII